MRSIESEKYFIKAEGASPSHRDIDVEIFFTRGEGMKLSNEVIALACQTASRRDRVQVVSEPQKGTTAKLTSAQIVERLVQFGADELVAEQMAKSLPNDMSISLVSGYCGCPFAAIVERPELPESLHLPYKIKWTTWGR